MAGPPIEIASPTRFVGTTTPVDVSVGAAAGALSGLTIAFEQNGTRTSVFDLTTGESAPEPVPGTPARVRVVRDITRAAIPTMKAGPARIIVRAARPVLFGLRHVETEATREVEVRLDPPRLSVLSTHHYINLGGTEAIVYRVSPADAMSGVVVGGVEYRGFPASGAGIDGVGGVQIVDPTVHIAFFALRHDQALATPMQLFARDEAGNTARAEFEHRVFPKPFRRSRIELNDTFLDRVVPAILAGTDEIHPAGTPIEQFVAINGDLRRRNAAKIHSFAAETSPALLWGGVVFHPFTNSSAESAFADQRTYIYQGKEVDRQVHLGFDLASYANTPIVAANRGKVLFAAELGIYGNCVILDHGMGVQSLYAHLSSIDVAVGATVDKGQTLGRSGMTGMAGGDHLHFTMLVGGQMVNPVEWWDGHWIEDRVLRKLKEAR
jgi:murein DD-endopeptidase MepM/ murein hydrolase activator NlpD